MDKDINVLAQLTVFGIFDFRAFLNLAMLLAECEKAKVLRQMMLDIVIDLINHKTGGATQYINQRDKDFISASLQQVWFFHEWKRLKEDEVAAVDLETMLRGMCDKANFMDLLENFIFFDRTGGRMTKILARNHQYLGVNEAVESYEKRKLKDGKLGGVLACPGERQKLFDGVFCPKDTA